MPAQRDKCHIFKCSHFEHFSSPSPPERYCLSHHSKQESASWGRELRERAPPWPSFPDSVNETGLGNYLQRSGLMWWFSKWERERQRGEETERSGPFTMLSYPVSCEWSFPHHPQPRTVLIQLRKAVTFQWDNICNTQHSVLAPEKHSIVGWWQWLYFL